MFSNNTTMTRKNAVAFLNVYTATLLAMAGPDFTWTDANGKGIGGSQAGENPTYGNARNGYRVLVWERQGGLCATCGETVALTDMEVAHFVGNGGQAAKSRGYVDYNIMGAHGYCNLLDAEEFGDVIPASSLAHPEFLMHSTPTRRECLAADKSFAAGVSASMAAYRAERFARRLNRDA